MTPRLHSPCRSLWLLLALALAGCSRASLPGDGSGPLPRAANPLERHVFPAELVMEHQAGLGLTPEQQSSLRGEVGRGQAEMLQLQWEMTAAREQLGKVLEAERPDEQAATSAAERVMEFENRIKLAHLKMLVRVKASLTREQQQRLRELRGQ